MKMVQMAFFTGGNYTQTIFSLLKRSKGRVCYVTLNKTSASLKKAFKRDNILYIDAVSAGLGIPLEIEALEVSSPAALTELGIIISEVLKTKAFDFFIFDTVSTLNVFDLPKRAGEQFVNNLVGRFRKAGVHAYFPCLIGDRQTALVKTVELQADGILPPLKAQKRVAIAAIVLSIVGLGGMTHLGGGNAITGYVSAAPAVDLAASLPFAVALICSSLIILIVLYHKAIPLIPAAQLRKLKPKKLAKTTIEQRVRKKLKALFKA